jgi:hypothetical protein
MGEFKPKISTIYVPREALHQLPPPLCFWCDDFPSAVHWVPDGVVDELRNWAVNQAEGSLEICRLEKEDGWARLAFRFSSERDMVLFKMYWSD